jgi:hypothetical protein
MFYFEVMQKTKSIVNYSYKQGLKNKHNIVLLLNQLEKLIRLCFHTFLSALLILFRVTADLF